jgi:CheY-like chemotaxis protein
MEVIEKCAKSQTRLVDDILDTSRIIAGSFALDAKPVEIGRIFQAAVDVIRPSADMKGVALTAVIDVQGDVVFGEASRLQQAIWNLLSNAVKFTDEGGRIEARLSRAGNQIEITISDTGIGIEPQFLPYVFERFRQSDSSSTRKYGGLGLGLTIAAHITELHGGSISASSPGRDQGATFRIRLPLAMTSRPGQAGKRRLESEAPRTKARKVSEERQMLDGARILLVEDDPETMDMLKFIFDECGAEVITAASTSEALEALEHFRPDALVSDIAMPNQDGFDLIRQVRSQGPEQGGKIPAVAVTAYASAEDRARVLASGFQTHVSKPIDPRELIATVASLTGHIHF